MFFKSYSEKLWGISCSDLDADFAAQRIRKFSLGEVACLAACGGAPAVLVDNYRYAENMTAEKLDALIDDLGRKS